MNKEQEKIYKELILKYKFTNRQKEEIKLGLEQNLDVSLYSNPEFTHDQMEEIRLGLEKGLNHGMRNQNLIGVKCLKFVKD